MSIDRRVGKKIPEFVKYDEPHGTRIDAGPFIGKIKNNKDPAFSGRLQVWIPEFGGDENFPENWRTVSYASPFLGTTTREDNDKNNDFNGVAHTYGMWFTVPDIGNLVMCMFVAGDPRRGFWFACVSKNVGHHMLPAIGSSTFYDSDAIEDKNLTKIKKHTKLPVAEFNENANLDWENFRENKKPIHEEHLKKLVEQGLDRDDIRGTISSNSQRESPSSVYGFSSPGRPLTSVTVDEVNVVKTRYGGHSVVLDDGDKDGKNNLVRFRTAAGHQIMMNDSDNVFYIINNKGNGWIEIDGDGKISVYAGDSINVRTKGDFNLHVDKDININAGGNLNLVTKKKMHVESESAILHSIKDTTLYGSEINIGASQKIAIDSKGSGSYTATSSLMMTGEPIMLNSGSGPSVKKPESISIYKSSDTEKDDNGQWQEKQNKIESAAKIVPAHEPWIRQSGKVSASASSASSAAAAKSKQVEEIALFQTAVGLIRAAVTAVAPPVVPSAQDPRARGLNRAAAPVASVPIVAAEVAGKVSTGVNAISTDTKGTAVNSVGQPKLSTNLENLDPGLKDAALKSVVKPCPINLMNKSANPTPPTGVGTLTQTQTKALMTQIAYNESGLNYGAVETKRGNYLGKYQMGAAALVDEGYIKKDAYKKYGTAAVNYPSSWVGKNGVTSKDEFLSNTSAQESAMFGLMKKNYSTMVNIGAIKNTDDPSTVSGLLSVSHLLGAGGANTWRKTGAGKDANKTTGSRYFNAGRYAHDVLSSS